MGRVFDGPNEGSLATVAAALRAVDLRLAEAHEVAVEHHGVEPERQFALVGSLLDERQVLRDAVGVLNDIKRRLIGRGAHQFFTRVAVASDDGPHPAYVGGVRF